MSYPLHLWRVSYDHLFGWCLKYTIRHCNWCKRGAAFKSTWWINWSCTFWNGYRFKWDMITECTWFNSRNASMYYYSLYTMWDNIIVADRWIDWGWGWGYEGELFVSGMLYCKKWLRSCWRWWTNQRYNNATMHKKTCWFESHVCVKITDSCHSQPLLNFSHRNTTAKNMPPWHHHKIIMESSSQNTQTNTDRPLRPLRRPPLPSPKLFPLLTTSTS